MEKIEYKLILSQRRTIAIQITPTGEIVVRAPKHMPLAAIDQFVSEKRKWIESHLPKQTAAVPMFTDEEIQEMAQRALSVIPARVKYYVPLVGVTYGNITIRCQRTRWGSCSGKGNLNFNCLLMRMPEDVIDYVVVHELCHRIEMNHSAKFWAEVKRVLPDYEKSKRWLKENGQLLIARLEGGNGIKGGIDDGK